MTHYPNKRGPRPTAAWRPAPCTPGVQARKAEAPYAAASLWRVELPGAPTQPPGTPTEPPGPADAALQAGTFPGPQ